MSGDGALASVIPHGIRRWPLGPAANGPEVGWVAVTIAVVLAVSPLRSGYFDFNDWGVVALGSMVLLVILALLVRPAFTKYGLAAVGGLGALLALSAASLLWAESKESAWTSVNRLALYAVLFGITVLAVRGRGIGRLVVLILGSAALLTSLWLCASLMLGGGQGAFLERRLNSPIGYINGTAGLLVMGVWPWIAYSETACHRVSRAGALAAASLIAGTLVLTQSRAVIPAMIFSAALVLLCADHRTRRAVNLILVGISVAVALPWTLAVYSSADSGSRLGAPGHGLLRAAAAAILVAALGAGLIRLVLSQLSDQIEAERKQRVLKHLGRGLAVATVAAFSIGSVLAGPWLARQYRSFTSLHVNQNVSVRFVDASGFRYDLWRVAAREVGAHPISGLGAGNYDVEYYQRRHNPEPVMQPHSLELQMAAELGVGGIAGLLLFCGAILWAGFARRGTLASEDTRVKIAATGTFAAWLAGTSLDWLYDIPGVTGMAMVAAGLLVVPSGDRRHGFAQSGRAGTVSVLGLVILAVLAASVGRQYAATRYTQAGASRVASSPQEAIRTLREAQRLDPWSLRTIYSLAAAYAQRHDYARARATLYLAAQREPHNYVPFALLGDLALRRGYPRLAESDYRHALVLNPGDPGLRASAGMP